MNSIDGSLKFQREFDRIVARAQAWETKFNVDKCEVAHMESNNIGLEHEMCSEWISNMDKETWK